MAIIVRIILRGLICAGRVVTPGIAGTGWPCDRQRSGRRIALRLNRRRQRHANGSD
jgi:hypothetical protein